MVKVYGISGRVTVEIKLPVGKAVLPLVFDKGCLDRKNYRPATFSTADKCIQDMIEGSEYYGKLIKLYKTYGKEKPVQSKKREVSSRTAGNAKRTVTAAKTVYPDVTNDEQARVVLKELGAKATQLKDTEAIKKTMIAFAVDFPNYTE